MGSTTGIELGPDSCVIVSARQGSGAAEVSAVHIASASDWPDSPAGVTAALKDVRRAGRFPRRASVVLWGLPEDALSDEPATRGAVRPVAEAGFKVVSVKTPAQALATLAFSRPRTGGTGGVAWLALNRHGAAMAIVRGNELLFARSFSWSYTPGLTGSRAQLLQRYSLVSHLAPEVRRGIALVRSSHGVTVDTAVTCGDLPELRSLTMPLIEELDIEVETLDSIDGLRAIGRAKSDRFPEVAPAIRLATAVAVAPQRTRQTPVTAWLRVAAMLLLLSGLGWFAYSQWLAGRGPEVQQMAQARPPASVPRPAAPSTARPATPAAVPPSSAGTPTAPLPTLPPASASPPSPAAAARGTAGVSTAVPPPAVTKPTVAQAITPPAATKPAQPPVLTPPPTAKPAPVATARARPNPSLATAPARASAERVPSPALIPKLSARAPRAEKPATPLKDPLPTLDSILIDHNRRLAIINGSIVRVGDSVGPRTVVEIDANAVTLREPSGLDVRIPLRTAYSAWAQTPQNIRVIGNLRAVVTQALQRRAERPRICPLRLPPGAKQVSTVA